MCSESANLRQGQNLNQKWSGLRIPISGLIQTRISTGSLPKCSGLITSSASVVSPSVVKKRPVTAWEMLINLPKSPILQRWGKWKSDPESMTRTGSPPKVYQFFWLIGTTMTRTFNVISWSLFQQSYRQADRQRDRDRETNSTDCVTSLAEVITITNSRKHRNKPSKTELTTV